MLIIKNRFYKIICLKNRFIEMVENVKKRYQIV